MSDLFAKVQDERDALAAETVQLKEELHAAKEVAQQVIASRDAEITDLREQLAGALETLRMIEAGES